MILLLSPSKTLDFDTPFPALEPTQPALLEHSAQLISLLKNKSVAQIQSLMDLSDKLAQLNHARYKSFALPFTPTNARPCFYAFKGDVYDGLEAESFDAKSRDRAQQHLRILSGLYGLLRPFDLIQPYRLEMGTRLQNPKGKDLYAFWGERLTDAINAALAESSGDTIINLASEEYFSAVLPKKLKGRLITPVFKERKGNQLKVIGLFAKRARGMMARHLLTQPAFSEAALMRFTQGNYTFDAELSNSHTFVFTR